MTFIVNSLLRNLTRTHPRLANARIYSTTTKKVSALVYSEKSGSSKDPARTVIFLPSSRLLISKTDKLCPRYEATHVTWQHYLSGQPNYFYYDEEEDFSLHIKLQRADVIPAEQESRIEELVKKIDELELLKRKIQTEIDHSLDKIDVECKKLSELFK